MKLNVQKFLENISINPDTNCWEWNGYRNKDGYGVVSAQDTRKLAHRVSYELHFGTIPNGLFVLHKCDNPSCINPDHLFLGTHIDNMKDMVSKNRQKAGPGPHAKGESNGRSKLKEDQVLQIREFYKQEKYSIRELSRIFLVSPKVIRNVVYKKTWNHI